MLSLEECRKHLGDTKMSDKEIEELRDSLRVLVVGVLDEEFKKFDELEYGN